jgi:hypothetical protein
MTDDLADPIGDQLVRRRAAWVLLVIGLIGIIVIGWVVLFTGARGGSPTRAAPVKPVAPSSSPHHSPSATKHLTGDEGNLLAALNRYRTRHGRSAVSGTVSTAAQTCASSGGAENRCPAAYYWEPVDSASGQAVIDKIVAKDGGAQWLLDRGLTAVQIGWARGTDGLHLCAIIKGA